MPAIQGERNCTLTLSCCEHYVIQNESCGINKETTQAAWQQGVGTSPFNLDNGLVHSTNYASSLP